MGLPSFFFLFDPPQGYFQIKCFFFNKVNFGHILYLLSGNLAIHMSVVKRFTLFLASIQSLKTSKFIYKYSSYIIFRWTTKKNIFLAHFFSRKSSLNSFFTLQVFRIYMSELSKYPHGALLQFKAPKHRISWPNRRAVYIIFLETTKKQNLFGIFFQKKKDSLGFSCYLKPLTI